MDIVQDEEKVLGEREEGTDDRKRSSGPIHNCLK